METQPRTPQMVFMQPQRLIVPLFQRPYVWNLETQWKPLWSDVQRVAERCLGNPSVNHQPHFLGAIVVQQAQNPTGSLQERTVIDGQQRLTTLQLMLDAVHAELAVAGAEQMSRRLESLVMNEAAFCEHPEDRYKVWPTNRDRPAFNEVMAAEHPVAYDKLEHRRNRIVLAHRFFAGEAKKWLTLNGEEDVLARAAALDRSIRELLQVVVIDLNPDEKAQEIFETLNARGAVLTAADLIKNLVFQRLMESSDNVEAAYEQYWKEFETGFWETEISAGRTRYSRSAMFLNHWIIARTGEEIVAREVFARFKQYVDFDVVDMPMIELVRRIHRASAVYRDFTEAATKKSGVINRFELFAYRTSVMESEAIKPLLLELLDPEQPPISTEQLNKALDVVESWMVRRMLVRATTQSYTQIVKELIIELRKGDRAAAGDTFEVALAKGSGANRYWPGDDELRRELATLPIYRRLSRARLRMVLEAIEDHMRGWVGVATGLGGERVARGKYAIEHVMPQRWEQHWPLHTSATEEERLRLLHVLGNLTLLTGPLNSKVSNGPWGGGNGKRAALEGHDVLILNRRLVQESPESWTEHDIRQRAEEMVETILKVWPVPEGHTGANESRSSAPSQRVTVADLIAAGLVIPGTTLYSRRKKHAERTATVLPDGDIDLDGTRYSSPSGAATAMVGRSANGWWEFVLDPTSKKSLSDLWHEYVDELDLDVDDEGVDDDD